MNDEIVSVETVTGMIEAEIVRGLLEASGIPVWLSHESAGTAYGLTVGPMAQVEIYVPRAHESNAREVLRGYREGTAAADEPPG